MRKMQRILSVRHTGHGHVMLRITGGERAVLYTVTEMTYSSLGFPPSGEELCGGDMDAVIRDDSLFRAQKKALGILSYGDVSRSMLRMKLLRAGFDRDIVEEAVKFAVQGGYLDEERQLARLVEREARESMRGPYYIKRKLTAKGYSSRDVSEAIIALSESGQIDFDEIFERLCDKLGASEEERTALAYKRGFRA